MSSAVIGYGLTLAFSTDDTTYVTIGEISDLTPFAPEKEEVEVTHYTSPNKYKEFIGGLIDAGSIEFTANYIDDATQDTSTGFASLIEEDDMYYWRITFSTGRVFKCLGFVTNFSVKAPIDDKVEISGTIKMTGRPTYS